MVSTVNLFLKKKIGLSKFLLFLIPKRGTIAMECHWKSRGKNGLCFSIQ